MLISDLGEFGFIERLKKEFASAVQDGYEGIGDDCAVLPMGGGRSMLVSTDMLLEGVHFLRGMISPYDLGAKSLAVNISDIAAMGGRPVASFLSIGLPADTEAEWMDGFIRGYGDMSRKYGVMLLGGDTTSSTGGVVINVTITGEAEERAVRRRSDARPGDVIVVNGLLGGSARGMREVLAASECGLPAPDDGYVRAHYDVTPCVEEGMWLASQAGVHAMMDLSDGLGSDIRHIMKASGVGAEIELAMIPTQVSVDEAVAGGEDYKLLLTVERSRMEEIGSAYRERFGSPLYIVGHITPAGGTAMPGNGLVWREHGQDVTDIVDERFQGFRHF